MRALLFFLVAYAAPVLAEPAVRYLSDADLEAVFANVLSLPITRPSAACAAR